MKYEIRVLYTNGQQALFDYDDRDIAEHAQEKFLESRHVWRAVLRCVS